MGEGGIIIHETSRKLGGLIATLFALLATMAGGIITLARRPRTHDWMRPHDGNGMEKVPETGSTLAFFAMAIVIIAAGVWESRRRERLACHEGAGKPA